MALDEKKCGFAFKFSELITGKYEVQVFLALLKGRRGERRNLCELPTCTSS
jgi:hypothetical protein